MELATQTLIASTSMAVASTTAKVPQEVSPWFSYTVDIILILIFLYILFFIKPDENLKKEATEEEGPNPLEQVLKTDSKEESETDSDVDANVGDDVEQRN